MKRMLKTTAALVLSGCMMMSSALAATTFTDVPSTHWGYTFINRAVSEGIATGQGDGTFLPDQPLSNAGFITMVCNAFYKSDVESYSKSHPSNNWWQSYLSVAYNKGLLNNTVLGDSFKVSQTWSTATVNASMSRYDMAQIMMNVYNKKGWAAPTTLELLAAQMKIKDWNEIPTKYQNAVASVFAKELLSGMGDNSFDGDSAMTRAHGTVVVCKLLDASEKDVVSNAYTNTTKLVNGKEPTETNVISALNTLSVEYPRNTQWGSSSLYTSNVLGTAFGCDAYAYTISDRVFGTFKAKAADFEDMKPGDLLYLYNERCHVVVTDVDGDEFTYTGCSSSGYIYWNGTGDIDDLSSRDTLYTRYTGTGNNSSGELSNGKDATESNVEDLIDDFLDEEYAVGDEWDETYRTDNFSSSAKTYSGSQAFAYYLSDYIFDELDVEDVDDLDDLRAGDVLYLYDEEEYVLVTRVSGDTIDYLGVNSKDKVYEDDLDVDDLDEDEDYGYTRYPDDDDKTSSGSGDTLSNGKSVTESNVEDLLEAFKDKKYDTGEYWDMEDSYTSSEFSSRSVTGARAFAYYLSDYIFDDLEVEYADVDEIRVGDVISLYDEETYGVVVEVDNKNDEITYVSVNSRGKVSWSYMIEMDELDDDEDTVYTRYLEAYSGSTQSKNTLSNGKNVTESNVNALIDEFFDDEYSIGNKWDVSKTYKSTYFVNKNVTGSQAFAYYFSDYIFGKLSVEYYDGDEVDIDDIRPGDVILIDSEDRYVVVTEVDEDNDEFGYVYTRASDGKIRSDWMDVDDLEEDDTVYTRYP